MQVRLWFLYSKDSLYSWPVVFRELLEHGSLEQKNHRETLKALTVMGERQPWPQFFVANDNPSTLQHVFDCQRQGVDSGRTWSLSDCNASCLSNLVSDRLQTRVSVYNPSVQFAENTLAHRSPTHQGYAHS